jgi:hypothetical protein
MNCRYIHTGPSRGPGGSAHPPQASRITATRNATMPRCGTRTARLLQALLDAALSQFEPYPLSEPSDASLRSEDQGQRRDSGDQARAKIIPSSQRPEGDLGKIGY